MKTKFEYLYRDASNYKQFHFVIVKGVIAQQQVRCYLFDKLYFIPSEIGLPDLQLEPLTQDDHVWHEIECLTRTEEPATVPFTARQLLHSFRKSHLNDWNFSKVIAEKGFI